MSAALDLLLPRPDVMLQMSADEYHADPSDPPSLSSSIAKILCTGVPAQARIAHPKLNPAFERSEEEKFDIGTVAHALVLQGEQIVEVIEATDWRTNAAKEAREAAREAGRVPLLTKDWERVEAMVGATRRQLEMIPAEPALFVDGRPEQTLIWQDEGVTCRARYDWLHDDLSAVDDFKTTGRSADPKEWGRIMFGFGADIQAAFYLRGLEKTLGVTPLWRFVVQENFPPYALSVVTLSEDVLSLARKKVSYAIALWRKCLADNNWPAYTREVSEIPLPAWEETRWLDREAGR